MSSIAPDPVDLSKYIDVRENRATIRGRRLPVAFVVSAQQANALSIAELAYEFTLSEEQVLAALLYYREHKAEVDSQDAADAQESAKMHRLYGEKPGQA
jgi:uncharacterized protein (DUF433 family)